MTLDELNKISKKELLKVKYGDFTLGSGRLESRIYDHVLIIPNGEQHESEFMMMTVIGVKKISEGDWVLEKCGEPDDIACDYPITELPNYRFPRVRMDCLYPSGALRYWGRDGKFHIGPAFSSMDIKFVEDKKN